MDWNII